MTSLIMPCNMCERVPHSPLLTFVAVMQGENFGTRLPLTYNVIITTITNYHLRWVESVLSCFQTELVLGRDCTLPYIPLPCSQEMVRDMIHKASIPTSAHPLNPHFKLDNSPGHLLPLFSVHHDHGSWRVPSELIVETILKYTLYGAKQLHVMKWNTHWPTLTLN